jgi:hypothetical protein
MYTGHVAIALAARGVRRDVPLWVLVLATQACDWVKLIAYLFTRRTDTEVFSHAYPFVIVAALAVAAAVWLWRRSVGAAATVMAVYLSHPLLDYVTGNKPLWLGGPNMGLGVIDRPAADFVVQGLVCLLGCAIYWRSLPVTRRRHVSAVAPLLLLLTLQGFSDLRLEWAKRRRERRSPPLGADSGVPTVAPPAGSSTMAPQGTVL